MNALESIKIRTITNMAVSQIIVIQSAPGCIHKRRRAIYENLYKINRAITEYKNKR